MVIHIHCTGDLANYEKLTSFLEDLGACDVHPSLANTHQLFRSEQAAA